MNRPAGAAILAVLAITLVVSAPAAAAHPLGNFTTNTSMTLGLGDPVVVDYLVDLAEIPALREVQRIDRDDDGHVGDDEGRRYRRSACDDLAAGLEASVDGGDVALRVTRSAVTFPPGEAGLSTLRLHCRLAGDVAWPRGEVGVVLRDHNFPDRTGWREVFAGHPAIVASDVPTRSASDQLRAYPEDRLQSPPSRRDATLRVRGDQVGGSGTTSHGAGGAVLPLVLPAAAGRQVDRLSSSFTDLVAVTDLTPTGAVLAIGVALLLGTFHAFAPGHGKTVMAALLLNRNGSARRMLQLAATVAAAHTVGVLLLGVLVAATQTAAPERVYPWLSLASGLLFAGVGLTLLRRALHDRGHGHGHGHGHVHVHHAHAEVTTWRQVVGPGLAGGLVPSPSALLVLLAGLSIGRAWFATGLVIAYGIGMAAALVGSGWLLVRLRDRLMPHLGAHPTSRGARLVAGLPVVTAAAVLAGGLLISVRGALEWI